jgi:hypothetical protein
MEVSDPIYREERGGGLRVKVDGRGCRKEARKTPPRLSGEVAEQVDSSVAWQMWLWRVWGAVLERMKAIVVAVRRRLGHSASASTAPSAPSAPGAPSASSTKAKAQSVPGLPAPPPVSPTSDVVAVLCAELSADDSDGELDYEEQPYGTAFSMGWHGAREEHVLPARDTPSRRDPSTPPPRDPAPRPDGYHDTVARFYHPHLASFDQPPRPAARFFLPHLPPSATRYSLVDSLIANLHPSSHWRDAFRRRQRLITKERVEAAAARAAAAPTLALSADQLQKVLKVWSPSLPPSIVVSSRFQIDITVRDLQTLCDGHWLNDNVIDFYLSLISHTGVFCWTTHFFTTLQAKGYAGVARWARRKRVDLTATALVLVPINIMGTHWALAAVDNKARTFAYYDSLSLLGNLRALQLVQLYMVAEAQRVGSSVNYAEYTLEPCMPTPQQQNGYDCGVFTCTLALYVARAQPLLFGQRDMKLLRRKMAYEILTKELIS